MILVVGGKRNKTNKQINKQTNNNKGGGSKINMSVLIIVIAANEDRAELQRDHPKSAQI